MAYIAGLALARMDRPYEAAEYLQLTVQGEEPQRDCLCEYGRVLMATQKQSKGVEMLRRATAIDPRSPYGWMCYAEALVGCGRFAQGIAAAERGLAAIGVLAPLQASAMNEYRLRLLHAAAIAWSAVGDLSRAGAAHATAVEECPGSLAAATGWAAFMNYVDATLLETQVALARVSRAVSDAAPSGSATLAEPWVAGQRPLRIGLLTPDLRDHPVAQFMLPLLSAIDAADVQWRIYHTGGGRDHVSDQCERLLGKGSSWLTCGSWDDASLSNAIASDKCDVLVDLAGWTSGSRAALMGVRLAPLQIGYLGYPQATGIVPPPEALRKEARGALGGVDGVIGDLIVCPAAQVGPHEVLNVTGTFMCWGIPSLLESPVPRRRPCNRGGVDEFVLGCFNNPSKISPRCGRLWARLLQRLPAATLLIKSRGLEHPENQVLCLDSLRRHGIDVSRVRLKGQQTSRRDHLDEYNGIDLALDPFPYNGATTTCEALWMGVPVVTLVGDAMQARVGASLLTAAGQEEWICTGEEAYVQRIEVASRDLASLRGDRIERRNVVAASVLCDAGPFSARWLAAVREGVTRLGNRQPRHSCVASKAAA